MHTLRLHISDGIYEKLIWFLKRFDKTELEIIQEDNVYTVNKEYLHSELNKIKANAVDFISLEELNVSVEKVISKYEN